MKKLYYIPILLCLFGCEADTQYPTLPTKKIAGVTFRTVEFEGCEYLSRNLEADYASDILLTHKGEVVHGNLILISLKSYVVIVRAYWAFIQKM